MTFSKSPRPLWALLALAILIGGYHMATPKGLRNNNPLNIRDTGANWLGKVGTDSDGFVIFESVQHGFRAAARILRTYAHKHQLTTISGIVARWAPPVENDTDNYIKFVSTKTGINPNQPLDRDTYPEVMAAMVHMENGEQPYPRFTIHQGFLWGFYDEVA